MPPNGCVDRRSGVARGDTAAMSCVVQEIAVNQWNCKKLTEQHAARWAIVHTALLSVPFPGRIFGRSSRVAPGICPPPGVWLLPPWRSSLRKQGRRGSELSGLRHAPRVGIAPGCTGKLALDFRTTYPFPMATMKVWLSAVLASLMKERCAVLLRATPFSVPMRCVKAGAIRIAAQYSV